MATDTKGSHINSRIGGLAVPNPPAPTSKIDPRITGISVPPVKHHGNDITSVISGIKTK
jgi:hypothetical protein